MQERPPIPSDHRPSGGRTPRGLGAVCLALLLACSLLAGSAHAAVPTGEYCVVGLGASTGGAADGWLATVTPGGVSTTRITVASGQLVNPWDCAIDPTTGDVIIVDEGNTGAATDGRVLRVAISGVSVTVSVLINGNPLVNPRGVSVGADGTIYVADVGATFNTNDNNGRIYSVTFPGGVPTLNGLTAVADGNVDSPVDLDIDPRPFGGAINVVFLERTGRIRRVITTPGANPVSEITTADPAGDAWEGIEVGPYGNYFIVEDSTPAVQRFDRQGATFTNLVTLAGTATPRGISVDYVTGDLVIADSDAAATGGVVNVPPSINLAGGAARTVVAAPGTLPGQNAAGVGFSPPLASTGPSANFGVPTRRAPIPGESITLLGPTYATNGGEIEHEIDLFIEVTDTSVPLLIRIFDPNVRDGYDVNLTGAYDTPARFTLYDPGGTQLTRVDIAANGSADLDQRIATLNSGNTLTARGAGVALAANRQGVYRLVAELPASDDWQGLGIWVERFNAYTYGFATGVSVPVVGQNRGGPPALTPLDRFRAYPYFDRGCEYTLSMFDGDSVAGTAIPIQTRLGQTFATTLSANGIHNETTIDPSPTGATARSNVEIDYGLHTMEGTTVANFNEFNVITLRTADFQGWEDAGGTGVPVPVPKGNATPNPTATLRTSPAPAFPQTLGATSNNFLRHYFPRYDETPTTAARPYAPYAMHSATPLAGDPPLVGTPAFYGVLVTLVNPDPVSSMSNVTLTATVPANARYVTTGTNVSGPAQATGGGIVTTCGVAPCAGTMSATWASIPAASAVTLSYAVRVTAASAGEELALTGGPSVRGGGAAPVNNLVNGVAVAAGTVVTFRPDWSSATFTRTESLGPLCELTVQQGTVSPVAVALGRFDATAGDGEVLLAWDTASEFRNLGFHVWRRLAGESDYRRVTPDLVLGRGTSDLAAHYAFRDGPVPNDTLGEYVLEDIELDGRSSWHGPVSATPASGLASPPLDPAELALQLPAPPAAAPPLLAAGAGSGGSGSAPPGTAPGATGPGSSSQVALGAPPVDTGSLRVLQRDANGVVVEIQFPQLSVLPSTQDGVVWTQVTAAGYDTTLTPGWPQLPARVFWLDVPDRARFALRTLERDGYTVPLGAPVRPVGSVLGAPLLPDPAAYASTTPYPATEAEVSGSISSGGQRLLALRVQPARFRAAPGELEIATRVVLRIDAIGPETLAAGASSAAVLASVHALAASPGLWLGVRGRGLVRVPASALFAAGLAADVDPRRLRLYRGGSERGLRVEGEADARLDASDALVFHAEGLDTRYSDEETFFLLPADTLGRRANDLVTPPSGAPLVTTVPAHARAERQTTYLPGILNGEGDNFVGPYVFDRAVASVVPTPGAIVAGASLRVRLRGGTTYADLPQDHHFALRVGGVDVLEARFDGSEAFDATVALPAGLVVDGETWVEVVPRFDSGAPFDLVYLDALDLDYRRAASLRGGDAGRLELAPDASGPLWVTGFSTPDAQVWDVTDDASAAVVAHAWVGPDALAFEASAGRRYAVSSAAGFRAPSRIASNAVSAWSAGGGADWIAIAPAALLPALQPLAARREQEGLRSALVDIQDVYDEASAGEFTPHAIRDFLRTIARSWSPAPRFVLLVGDATYDYRDHLHGAARNLVPTMLVDTTFVEAASDGWFGVLDDAQLAPDLLIGRIPVRNAAELDAVVAKILAYETAAQAPGAETEAWRTRLLSVADDGAGAGNVAEADAFEGVIDAFAQTLSSDFVRQRVALRDLPNANAGALAGQAIGGALQQGVAMALYAGHGGARVWADELIFGAGDVATIANGATLPFFVVLNCLNAFFDAPNEESLGELALRAPDRGAIAYLSSTTVSALAGQDALGRALAERILRANVRRVGEAVTAAKQAIASDPGARDVIQTFVLLGDPATRLGIPVVPLADAGPDLQGSALRPVTLDGRASTSPRLTPLGYAWRILREPAPGAGAITNTTLAQSTFFGSLPGAYEIELVVNDGAFASPADVVRIDVGVGAPAASCLAPPPGSGQQQSALDLIPLLLPILLARRRRPND